VYLSWPGNSQPFMEPESTLPSPQLVTFCIVLVFPLCGVLNLLPTPHDTTEMVSINAVILSNRSGDISSS
jgi:hypothetical protein